MSFSVYKSGEFKDMTGFWRSPTSEEEDRFKGLIDEIYGNFIQSVATGRRMDEEKVREYATGEVFTGKGAHERGLVDELGDFDRALELAAELGRYTAEADVDEAQAAIHGTIHGPYRRPGSGRRVRFSA